MVICGATGQLGSAAVLAALARGAGRVVAVGRSQARLDRLAGLSTRVVPVVVTDDVAAALRQATKAGADLVVDLTAHMPDPSPVIACLETLRPDGTAVLVGGQRGPLPLSYGWLMRNRVTQRGSFMFDRRMADATWQLLTAGRLDLSAVRAQSFGLEQMDAAISTAGTLGGLDIAVLLPNGPTG